MSDTKSNSRKRAFFSNGFSNGVFYDARQFLGNVSTAALMSRRAVQTSRVLLMQGVSWLSGNQPPVPKLLRSSFEQLGSTYIKLGQFIASSPSFFPEEYVTEFQHCLDNAPAIPFSSIKKIVEKELGQPLHNVYSFVDETPLATASIAQVHAAKLNTGEDVVIKVQKPDVDNIIKTDFSFLFLAARFTEWFAPGLSRSAISGVISELQSSMLEECDFLQEARNLDQFNQFLHSTNNEDVVAPKPYHEFTTRKVLTMERFFGVSLVDLDTIEKYTKNPSGTLVNALNTWFSSLMLCDFFHADLHAGNLMMLENGKVGFIDFGIVGRISKKHWQSLMGLMNAVQYSDYDMMADAMIGIGMTKTKVDKTRLVSDLKIFAQKMRGVDEEALRSGYVNDNEINNIIMELAAIGESHGIRFPRAFALLIKQFLYFDRYVQALSPEMNLFDDDRLDFMPMLNDLIDVEGYA